MTEKGESWALNTAGKKWPKPGIPEQAEYWLRAFVAEVEKRSWVDTWARGDAFVKLARELLGDK